MATTWTNASIVSGIVVKKTDITELRAALILERTRRGLAAPSWTDNTITEGNTQIKAVHPQEIRNNITDFSALSVTNASLVGNKHVPIDITELRTKINALENHAVVGGTSDCNASCTGLCTGCSGSCTGTCTGCSGSCTGTCTGCSGTCTGTCTGCSGTCTGCSSCTGSCTGCSSCTGTCSGCSGSCTGTCTGCSGTCTGSCTGCSGSCTGSCTGCSGTCTGTCTGCSSCTGSCTGTCTSCSGSCTGTCTGCSSCTGSCTGGCTGCSGNCTGTCTGCEGDNYYCSCFPSDSKITMFDKTEKNIQDIKAGDKILGIDGNAYSVNFLYETKLGERSLYRFKDGSLCWSEEHPLWIKDIEGNEYWGVWGYNAYIREMMIPNDSIPSQFKDFGLKKKLPNVLYSNNIEYAHLSGWKKQEVYIDRNVTSDLVLYDLCVDGPGTMIVNGYVASAFASDKNFDFINFKWGK